MPTYRTLLHLMTLLVVAMSPGAALAVAADECEQQRGQYPKEWNDVSNETPVFTCTAHYATPIKITLGKPDAAGRRLMSLAHKGDNGEPEVFRIWLDKEQARRLQDGRYFATILRQQTSCWIRGALNAEDDKDPVFFMDNAGPPADGPDKGPFYNKAPRFSVFKGDAYDCARAK